jgi:hypothetical protein
MFFILNSSEPRKYVLTNKFMIGGIYWSLDMICVVEGGIV